MSDYSTATGRDECAGDEMDTTVATSSDEESIDEDFNLWEQFVQFTIESRGELTISDTLCYFLSPYILRSEDETYKEIMYDVEEAFNYQNMTYIDALDYALEKNKDLILTSVDDALKNDCGDEDSFTIWCALAASEKKNIGCRWLSYSPCYCNDCCGTCAITHLQYMLVMFHHMSTDDVIHDILLSIRKILKCDDEVTLWDASHIAVEKHENVISEMVREAEKEISERIMMKKKDGQGMYLNPWGYMNTR